GLLARDPAPHPARGDRRGPLRVHAVDGRVPHHLLRVRPEGNAHYVHLEPAEGRHRPPGECPRQRAPGRLLRPASGGRVAARTRGRVALRPGENTVKLPTEGKTRADVMASLERSMAGDLAWNEGRTFSLVYGVGAEHLRLLQEAYSLFMATNGLGAGRIFKSLSTLEGELVSMSAELLGGADCPGNVTSGGSESIILGVRAAQERARAERPQITRPELVLPASAHPAFDKAAHIFGIRNVRTPITKDYVADVQAMADAVNENTIGLVASAPNYPFGTIDPVTAIAEIARRHALHLHVDACVGGFALPFLRKLGQPIPSFDFTVPEVSTISADLHKYGFAARGTSLILYRDQALQRRVGFQLDDWAGGPYRTPTMAGSRPGGVGGVPALRRDGVPGAESHDAGHLAPSAPRDRGDPRTPRARRSRHVRVGLRLGHPRRDGGGRR